MKLARKSGESITFEGMKKNDFSMRELVEAFSQQPAYRDRLNQAKIRIFWDEQMSNTFKEAVQKIIVKNRKLYITVHSSVVRQELQLSKEALLRRMNQVLEEEYLQEVIIY